jgi:hypothetical protein
MKNGELVMLLAPVLTPHGVLTLRPSGDGAALEPDRGSRLEKAFAKGPGHGLLCLGADEVGTVLPPVLSYWREFGGRYVTALCALPGISEGRAKPPVVAPANPELEQMVLAVPPMTGAEYLTSTLLADLWHRIDAAFDAELAAANLTVQEFLKDRHPAWNLVGRVHFNLAENRKDEDAPFAFLATYTTRLSMEAKAQHLPLGKALQEYSGARNRERLLSLLMPVQRASEQCSWLKAMVEAGEIYPPLREGDGLFPAPKEIKLSCSCPDWADKCKHVAAALYGVGARLDEKPALLFELRGVDENQLLANAGQKLSLKTAVSATTKVLDDGDVAALFGLEMVETVRADTSTRPERPQQRKTSRGPKTRAGKRAVAYKKGKRKHANWQETPVPNLSRPLAVKDFSAAAFADDEPELKGVG